MSEADLMKLPLGTRFYVVNGAWYGRVAGTVDNKTIFVEETGKTIPLTEDHDLTIEIEEGASEMQKVVKAVLEDYEFEWETITYLKYDGRYFVEEHHMPVVSNGTATIGDTIYVTQEKLSELESKVAEMEKELKRLRRIERRAHARWLRENPQNTTEQTVNTPSPTS